MYVEIVSGSQPFTAGRVCFKKKLSFAPLVPVDPPLQAAAIQRTRTQFARRAFSVCGPDVWHSLPASIRTVDS